MSETYKPFGDLTKGNYIYRIRYDIVDNNFKSDRLIITDLDNDSLNVISSFGPHEELDIPDWNATHLTNLRYECFKNDVHYFSDVDRFHEYIKHIQESLTRLISKYIN